MVGNWRSRFTHEPSERYVQALAVLEDLMEAEGTDAVTRVCADAVHKQVREQYMERDGLQETNGRRCIQRLRGGHCKRFNPGRTCECTPPADDHPELFVKDGKADFYVSQPYHLNLEDLRDIVAFCDRYDLKAVVSTWPAWHFPGRVLHVEYRRRDAED